MAYSVSVTLDGKDNLSPALRSANTGMDSLVTAAKGFVVALASQQLIQALETTYSFGREAIVASSKFNALAESIGGGAQALEMLRAATGGGIRDVQLMSDGATLLQLNIANSNTQLAEMLGLATKLGDVDAFISVMKNGASSAEMLDNVGVSAARVKAIVADMGKTMSDPEAYGQAVIIAMREAVERLGTAADANVTAVDRLQVRWDNFWNSFQSRVAQGIDAFAAWAETTFVTRPTNEAALALVANMDAKYYWNAYGEALDAYIKSDLERVGLHVSPAIEAISQQYAAAAAQARAMEMEFDGTTYLSRLFQEGGISGLSGTGLATFNQILMSVYNASTRSVEEVTNAFKGAITEAETLQDISAQGLIADEDVKRAKAIADSLTAASKLNLTGLLGISDGGAMGEIFGEVLSGLPEGLQSEATRLFDLASGRANDLSLVMEDNVIPMLQALYQVDPTLATQAVNNLTLLLQNAAAMGLGPGATAGIITGQYLPTYGGFSSGGVGKGFTVKPGDTASQLAIDLKTTIAAILAAAGAKDAAHLMPGQYNLAGGGGGMVYGGADWSSALHTSFDPTTYTSALEQAAGYTVTMADNATTVNTQLTAGATWFTDWLATAKELTLGVKVEGERWIIELLKAGGVSGAFTGGGNSSATLPARPGGKNQPIAWKD